MTESPGEAGRPPGGDADASSSNEAAAARASSLPEASLVPERRLSWAWALPVIALLFAIWLAFAAWSQRGLAIEVYLPAGHGLRVGGEVRYRGIAVGEVRDVALDADLDGVVVTATLHAEAARLARAGSRFWVVRPRLQLTGIEGVETLVGPRYLAVVPAPPGAADEGRKRLQREFVGLPDPPVVEWIDPDDLEIVLEAARRGSLRPGASVTYRQMPIGSVLSAGLASDGSLVEARVHIPKAYRGLIREHTRFWDVGGLRADVSLAGVRLEVDSLEELLVGGLAVATPPAAEAGGEVHTGHRFVLAAEADAEWLEWEPGVAVGSSLLPPGAVLPQPLRATIAWKQGFIFKGRRTRRGWVLQTAAGVLGPADLLTPDPTERADAETVSLEVAGQVVPLEPGAIERDGDVARLDVRVSDMTWPDHRMREPAEPEDCIAVGDPTATPLPLATSRLTAGSDGWLLDPAIAVATEDWHGASVVSRRDGRLIGILIVDEDAARVVAIEDP